MAKPNQAGPLKYWSSFFLSIPAAMVWSMSFCMVYIIFPTVGDDQAWQQFITKISVLAPLAAGYRERSLFPELSFQYFALMQPLTLSVLSCGRWYTARHQDYSGIVARYRGGTLALKVGSCIALSCFVLGSVIAYTWLGGQELPGTRINSSRLSLAIFGPVAAAALAVYMSLWAINVARYYLDSERGENDEL